VREEARRTSEYIAKRSRTESPFRGEKGGKLRQLSVCVSNVKYKARTTADYSHYVIIVMNKFYCGVPAWN